MRGSRLREALKKTIALKVRCAAAESDISEEVRVRIEASTRAEDFGWQPESSPEESPWR